MCFQESSCLSPDVFPGVSVAVDREGGSELCNLGLDAFKDGLILGRLKQVDDQVRDLCLLYTSDAADD